MVYHWSMRIFALDTDFQRVRNKFLQTGDTHLLTIRYHSLKFWLAIIREVLLSVFFIALAITVQEYTPLPWEWIYGSLAIILLLLAIPVLRQYIDWRFDFIEVTSDKVIVVDQSSIFKMIIKQINMENFASVDTETQFLNLFPFGKVHFNLKEGVGKSLTLNYIPRAAETADLIADAVSDFQKRKESAFSRMPQGQAPAA